MAFTTVLSRNNWPAGKHSFGPFPIDAAITQARARMARFEKLGNGNRKNGSEWVDIRDAQNIQQDVIQFNVEISLDGGNTWRPVGGGRAAGGVVIAPPGPGLPPGEAEYTMFGFGLPDAGNPNRQLRGSIETFATLGTIVEVELI